MQLSDKDTAKAKVIFCLTVVGLLAEKIATGSSDPQLTNPATRNCAVMIDEIIGPMDEDTKRLVTDRVNKARVRLTKRVSNLQIENSFVGALRFLTGGSFKTRTGTRLDYIVGIFRHNLASMETSVITDEREAKAFHRAMVQASMRI